MDTYVPLLSSSLALLFEFLDMRLIDKFEFSQKCKIINNQESHQDCIWLGLV
jgi:hypothetical protein